jgi:hypothetical protein
MVTWSHVLGQNIMEVETDLPSWWTGSRERERERQRQTDRQEGQRHILPRDLLSQLGFTY